MSGSRKFFKYTTDSGDVFAIAMDESNGELVGNADFGLTDDGVLVYMLPRNVRPRTALYRSTDGRVSRRIPVTDNTATIATLPGTFQVLAADGNPQFTMQLQSFRGEEIKRLYSVDTAQDDGDIT
jgi:hypothetical protein